MRVFAGSARGRRLQAPGGRDIRPPSDRVREAIFSSLDSMDAITGAHIVDLFAGTGALGIEALSRGAASALLVERDPRAVAVIRANLDALGLAGAGVVEAASPEDVVAGIGELLGAHRVWERFPTTV